MLYSCYIIISFSNSRAISPYSKNKISSFRFNSERLWKTPSKNHSNVLFVYMARGMRSSLKLANRSFVVALHVAHAFGSLVDAHAVFFNHISSSNLFYIRKIKIKKKIIIFWDYSRFFSENVNALSCNGLIKWYIYIVVQ